MNSNTFIYLKDQHTVKIYCPYCQDILTFTIPEELFTQSHSQYPFTFSYIHGQPPHSVTLYIDKNHDIRGQEFGDSLLLSREIIDNLFRSRDLNNPNAPNTLVLQSILNTFSTVLDATVPNSDMIKKNVGHLLGDKLTYLFPANTIEGLLDQLKQFWRSHGFGFIDEISINSGEIFFNVYECFECSHLPDIGRPMCKLDEAFLTKLLDNKFHTLFLVKELECFATGHDHCRFSISSTH